jgi:hypothetical protein
MNRLLILLISIPCVLCAECKQGDTSSCSCETTTGSTSATSFFSSFETYSEKCAISTKKCDSSYKAKVPAPTCCDNCCKSNECNCKAELCIYPKCPSSDGSKVFTGFTDSVDLTSITADKCGCGDANLKKCLIGQICVVSTANKKPQTCNCCSKGGTVRMNGRCTCKFFFI